MKRDWLLVLLVMLVVALAFGAVYQNHVIERSLASGHPEVDLDQIRGQIESGNLSDHDALFFRAVEDIDGLQDS